MSRGPNGRPAMPSSGMPPRGTPAELAVVATRILVEVLDRAGDIEPRPTCAIIGAPGGGGDRRFFTLVEITKELRARGLLLEGMS